MFYLGGNISTSRQCYVMKSQECHDVKQYIKTSKSHCDIKGASKFFKSSKIRHEVKKYSTTSKST